MTGRLALALVCTAGCRQLLGIDDAIEDDAPMPDAGEEPTLSTGCAVIAHMDEPAWTGAKGEVIDECGGDNHGTADMGLTTVAGGVRGRAGSFNGTGCVRIDDAPVLHATRGLTMSAWIKPAALNGVDAFGIVSKRIDTGVMSAYNVYVWTGNKVYVDLDGENDRFSGQRQIANDKWAQITVVYSGDVAPAERVRVYVDGALDVVATETSPALPAFTSPLLLGCLPSSVAVQNFIGLLDEVVVWTRPLAPAEVAAWYAQTRPL
ncbi:MAG: LamG domain-containing protein [Deltaproteobacteria bacterium]|nr:LamG domain-containing protein [Deltaproteobacteria bacterium]